MEQLTTNTQNKTEPQGILFFCEAFFDFFSYWFKEKKSKLTVTIKETIKQKKTNLVMNTSSKKETLLNTLHSQSKKKPVVPTNTVPTSAGQPRQIPPSDRMAYACLAIIGLAVIAYLAYELFNSTSATPSNTTVPLLPTPLLIPSPIPSASNMPLVNALLLPANQIPPAL